MGGDNYGGHQLGNHRIATHYNCEETLLSEEILKFKKKKKKIQGQGRKRKLGGPKHYMLGRSLVGENLMDSLGKSN